MADLARLIESQIPALRRYAYALTRDHDAADDLVQDTLERALRRWSVRGDAMRPWLFSVLHNLFVDGIRARRRNPLHHATEAGEITATILPAQDSTLLRRDILSHFGALSTEHQTVLLLVTIEGFAYSEVAGILGVPVGTVMSRLYRAREAFRRLLDEEQPALRRIK